MHSDIIDFCTKNALDARLAEPLSNHTTMKVGGQCPLLAYVSESETLKQLICLLEKYSVRYYILGRGSNVLVSDNGFDGVVIKLNNSLAQIECDVCEITCGAGASLKSVCIAAYENSLSGLEFAYGIPGSIGGALFMNAGAYGGQLSDVVQSATCFEDGVFRKYSAEQMALSYRKSIFMQKRNAVILSVTLRLKFGKQSQIKEKMDELLAKRREKQPLEYPSAGSMFKRPQGSYASLLIEQCGLKGYSVGGAQISEKHSGFVINKGNATFSDIITLTDHVKETVFEQTGYKLEIEPEILR